MSQHSHFYGRQVNYIKIEKTTPPFTYHQTERENKKKKYTIDYFCFDILNCLYENKISFYIYIYYFGYFSSIVYVLILNFIVITLFYF